MRKSIIFSSMVLMLLLGACKQQESNVKILTDVPVVKANPEILIDSVSVDPSQLLYHDGFILIRDTKSSDGQLKLYNLSTGAISSFVKRGRGPGEMMGFYDLDLSPDGKQLYMLDVALRKVIVAPTDSLFEAVFPYSALQQIDFSKTTHSPLSICATDDIVYASSISDAQRFARINNDGSIFCFGEYSPATVDNKHEYRIVSQAYMGRVCYDAYAEKLIQVCRYADQIELFNPETNQVQIVKGPDCFEPAYELIDRNGSQALVHREDERFGYIAVDADLDNIYALFSGRTREHQNPSYASEIRVIDKSFELKRRIVFDYDLISFDVSSGIVYTLTNNGQILKYAL